MCGIAGILKIHPPAGPGVQTPPHPLEAIPEAWLDILDDSIKHRGPDGAGRFRDRAVRPDGTVVDIALVHRRLSIIDHAGGHQPMVHDGNRLRPDLTYGPGETPILAHEVAPGLPLVAVVFNGCIYNHRELRAELEASGQRFETDHSDTEVLVRGWRTWGQVLPGRLEGMFAWTAWDRRTADLFAARDSAGEKPLATSRICTDSGIPQSFIFSSCLGGLVRLLTVTGEDLGRQQREKIEQDLRRYDEGWQLEHVIRIDGREVSARRVRRKVLKRRLQQTPSHATSPSQYILKWEWTRRGWGRASPLEFVNTLPHGHSMATSHLQSSSSFDSVNVSVPQPLDRTLAERLLRRSVIDRLEADVPIGCFLSGGIDSALITHFAAETLRSQGRTLLTMTVRMPDPRYDESKAAEETATLLDTEHHTIDCESDPAGDLVRLIEQLGMPFGDSSLLPTYWLCKAAHSLIRVALAGDGGDELFAGYDRHRIAFLPKWIWWAARIVPPGCLPRRDPLARIERFARLGEITRGAHPVQLYSELDHFRTFGDRSGHCGSRSWFPPRADQYIQTDRDEYLPADLLRKVDTASMACPIEVRAPFLDRQLKFCATRTPISTLMPNGERKGLLKQVARQYLPEHIINRPKRGFAIPIGEWFRTDYGQLRQLLHDHLRSADPFPGLAEAGVNINMGFVEQMLKEHDAAGEKSINPWHGRDHSQRLYMLLVLSIWAKWLDRVRRGEDKKSRD